ncbi:hypothetical protein M885DRAFT_520195 [Pelagophyceae sp. CCMP2097]|nr:hypothetical protein M885DRAFT_520195 [Pelagophyceae sp. CCMP2097]
MAVVLSRAELERMQRSVQPEQITDSEARRRRLKEISDDKVKQWPNTLQATRLKKDNYKKERMETEELARQEVDKTEAALQGRLRAAAIKRANAIMYETTDKMKFLRSQQAYGDVVLERREQIEEKKQRADWEAGKDDAYAQDMFRQVRDGDAREKLEAAARSSKARAIAASQFEQLGEFRGNYLERLRQEKREGAMVKSKAIADQEEDERDAVERQLKARMQVKAMQLANANLKKLKFEDAQKEEVEDRGRAADKQRKEDLSVARKTLERNRFDSRQATKQRLIDLATAELEQRTNTDALRLESQVEALRAKEDNAEAAKQDRIARQKRAIDLSRQQQLEARAKERALDDAATEDMVSTWRRTNADIDADEEKEADNQHFKKLAIRDSLLASVEENKRRKAQVEHDRLAFDAATRRAIVEDNERFQKIADEEIDKAKTAGRSTYMLEKAKHARDITMLPAMGSRI